MLAFSLIFARFARTGSAYIFGQSLRFASTIPYRDILAHRVAVSNIQPKIPFPSEVSCHEQLIPTSDGLIPVKIYLPNIKPPFPTVFFVHGTGFISPEYKFSDLTARYLALGAHAQIIDIHHRVAPENPYPIPFKDVYGVYQYITQHLSGFKIDPEKIVISGYSSGGTLAAQLAINIQLNRAVPSVKKQILICPFLDCSGDLEKEKKFAKHVQLANEDKKITAEFVRWVLSLYAPSHLGINLKDPSISPYWHSLHELSKTVPAEIIVGQKDRVRAHAQAYAEKLAVAKVISMLHISIGDDHTAFWEKLYFINYVAKLLETALYIPSSATTTYDRSFFAVRYFKENDRQEENKDNCSYLLLHH